MSRRLLANFYNKSVHRSFVAENEALANAREEWLDNKLLNKK